MAEGPPFRTFSGRTFRPAFTVREGRLLMICSLDLGMQGFYARPAKSADGSLDLMKWEVGIPGKPNVRPLRLALTRSVVWHVVPCAVGRHRPDCGPRCQSEPFGGSESTHLGRQSIARSTHHQQPTSPQLLAIRR